MIQRVKDAIQSGWKGADQDPRDELLRRLQFEVSALRRHQRMMARELNESQVRNDFKRIQLDHELRSLRDKANNISIAEHGAEKQIRDVAIEEKVDASRLAEQLQKLSADAADAGDVQDRLATLQEYIEQREDALKADITVIESAIQDTVDQMRQDLIDSFDKEFIALETVLTYEMDAMEAQDKWAHERLEDQIDAVRTSLDEDFADLESDTISLLTATTTALAERLDTQTGRLSAAQKALEQQMDARFNALAARIKRERDVIPDAEALAEMDDTEDLQDVIDTVQQRLEEQQNTIDTARTELQNRLDDAVATVRNEEIQPLRDAVTTLQQDIDTQIDGSDALQQMRDEQDYRQTAAFMDLERRISQLEQRIEQELAATEVAQTARRTELQDTLNDTLTEHDDALAAHQDRFEKQAAALESLSTGMDKALSMMEEMDTDMTGVQDRIEELAEADDLDGLQEMVDQIKDDLNEKAPETAIEELQDHINTIKNDLTDIQDEKADTAAVEEQLAAVSEELSNDLTGIQDDIDTIQDEKADTAAVTEQINDVVAGIDALKDDLATVQEQKADVTDMTAKVNDLSQDLDEVQDRMTAARNTLDVRLTELEEHAADATDVMAVKTQVKALKNAAARQDTVQAELERIRSEFTTVQDQSAAADDVSDLYKRVQKLREQLGTDTSHATPPNDRRWYVNRREFQQLERKVDELSDYVTQLLNKE